jgi:hypothetical protein
MSALSLEPDAGIDSGVATLRSFWHRVAAGIDALGAYPVKHALSDRQLRRVDDDIERCRQLMSTPPQRRSAVVPRRVSAQYAFAAIKVQP